MKLLTAGIAVFLLASAGVEAAPKLPKPIDHPIVRPKVRDDHKAGKRAGKHPESLSHSTYGAEWGKILNTSHRHHEIPKYLFQSE